MSPKIIRSLAIIGATVGLSGSAVYASFTSNTVSIANNLLTTGEASVKLCDIGAANNWSNGINPSLNLSGMIPSEERDLLVSREVLIGNDNGALATAAGAGKCIGYRDPASSSNTPMRIIPTISFAGESCADPLPSVVRLRFEVNGFDSGYKTLNSWSTNTTAVDNLITPGTAVSLKAYAQVSSTATAQKGNCNFTINLAGKQPTT